MSIFKSKHTAYNPKKNKSVPIWKLDTSALTVTYFNPDNCTEERKTYYSDCIKYHLHYSADKYPDRLRRLVNDGTIISYLDDLESSVTDAIDRQVQLWKESDKEYLTAVECGDVQTAEKLENCLVLMAREIAFECMVYI
ncbi:MAG: hypothetical protein ACI4JB_05070 [Porcipelethomonas sp.]